MDFHQKVEKNYYLTTCTPGVFSLWKGPMLYNFGENSMIFSLEGNEKT
jgi:hypothetical protein